jgi:hypothetical protein
MQAENGARPEMTQDVSYDLLCGPFPVVADNGPHTAEQAETALSSGQAKPAHPIGRAE